MTGFRIRTPRIGTTLGIGVGTLASLAPGLLPRTPGAQAVLTGLLAALTLGAAGALRILLRRSGFDVDRRHAWLRLPLSIATSVLVVGAAANAGHWQNRLRAAMGTPPIGADYWVRCAVGAALIVGLLAAATHSIAWTRRKLGWARGVSLAAVAAVLLYLVGVPALVGWRETAYARANAELDPAVVRPVSHSGSGTAESAVSWTSLGAEGRKFVSDASVRAVRVYVGVASAPDLDSRVALAIEELERSGGFARSHLVVTVPTGSGWIDANAVAGFDRRFDGDVALVGLQYSYLPSWATFVFGRDTAVTAARTLFTAVEHHIQTLPRKPKLYLYGQSLGALGGNAVFTDDAEQDARTCAVLWAGPPANRVNRGGATVLANSSDPVIHWSLSQLWRAPDLTGARVDAPVPRWLPVISFAQTTADLLAALDAPPGHGHRYGRDQGTLMGSC
ncbi:alpha/beta-hydrolase family protein [Nocardia sp. CDC186]|uniref:Alpha/beta-hydrolase family protein n=1 Tax=Nocardia implantans TaxID=3108168 RepID=A0ABU6ATH7_9NOCA|nr:MULTISPECIES: alpha/beta-hydrolase family protein [unclassified Nocardia]MBF6190998.1 alpha/beta-hydrolase family protein [Nocardia beijingensis]MEA3528991.1 alpha/beta-hydrolase family protein [Nocardia sp. CDC192]MEB3510656.1 alpha/beta-hydrolase family protein [Nocardia sp. CDC186]